MSDVSSVPSRVASPVSLTPDQLPTARPYRFTWDPASRRPGPESVSGTTEGKGGDDFAAAPHPLGFLNHSTTSLALGSLPTDWSSSRTGFHGSYLCLYLSRFILTLNYSYIHCSEQSPQTSGSAKSPLSVTPRSTCRPSSCTTQGL